LSEKLSVEDRRESLFRYLDLVLKRAEKKIKLKRNKAEATNQAWARIIIQAVNAYGRLLETEELEARVEKLEVQLRGGVLIPNEIRKPKNTRFRR